MISATRKLEFITIELLSDATFSNGQETPGQVDIEVEHDDMGLPYLSGKTLHGLLRNSWLSMERCFSGLARAASRVYGPIGDLQESSILRIGDALTSKDVHDWVKWAGNRAQHPVSPRDVLAALTDIRVQTSEDRKTGVAAETTLRSARVILRGLRFESSLTWLSEPEPDDLRCLALGVLGTRHAGLSSNRGRGRVRLAIDGDLSLTCRLAKGRDQ